MVESTPSSNEERTWAMVCHLAALAGLVVPLGNIFGPLVVWLVKKEAFPLVDDQGKESVNFQLSITLYMIVAGVLILVLIGIPLLIGLGIYAVVMLIIASIRANEGQRYRYPLTIRFIT